jgi:hypothetical protein
MATIKLQGNSSGSGSVILTAPNTNSTRTITLPDEDINLGNVGGASATVNFTAYSTFSVRGSSNVSSVTDQATGNFKVNYSNNLASSTYTSLGAAGNDATSYADGNDNTDHGCMIGSITTSYSYIFSVDYDTGAPDDAQYIGLTANE